MGKQLILQPAGKGAATLHYKDTIANPVPLARIKPFLSDGDFQQLRTFILVQRLRSGVSPQEKMTGIASVGNASSPVTLHYLLRRGSFFQLEKFPLKSTTSRWRWSFGR